MIGRSLVLSAALGVIVLACSDDPTAPPGTTFVSLRFATPMVPALSPSLSGHPALGVIEGTNGQLDVTGVQVIVAEFELETEDDSCEDGLMESCSEFEAGPFFMDLPLDGTPVALSTEAVPNGVYEELDFEIEDLEDDGPDDAAVAATLLQEVRTAYPDWPDGASMRAEGTFTPTGGSAAAFIVYFDAEVEIELDFATPLVLDDARASADLTIQLDPDAWFTVGDGSVVDLSQYDWDLTSQLLEFEVEIEDGFTDIEVDGN